MRDIFSMGRKRNQGKARKAAKARAEEEAKEETGDINQTTDGRQQPLAAQMQHLLVCHPAVASVFLSHVSLLRQVLPHHVLHVLVYQKVHELRLYAFCNLATMLTNLFVGWFRSRSRGTHARYVIDAPIRSYFVSLAIRRLRT